MGKANMKKKAKPAKSSPIINESFALKLEEENNTPEQVRKNSLINDVLPVIKQLSSPNATERAWAASCVSNLIMGDIKTLRLLLSKNIIGILIERLTDSVYEVVFEALGTLRNLTIVGEHEVCAEMYNKDVLTPLMALVPKISIIIDNILKGNPPESDPIKGTRKTIWNLSENLIYIIWSLSETSQRVLKGINNTDIVPFLMSFLTQPNINPANTIAAAQCLYTITDENPDIHIHFKQHKEYVRLLLSIINLEENTTSLSDDYLLIKVLCCGILSNICSIVNEITDINNSLMPILVLCLTLDINKCADEAVLSIENIQCAEVIIKHPKDALPITDENNKLDRINARIMTLQLALEILAKICLDGDYNDDEGGFQNGPQENDDSKSINVKEKFQNSDFMEDTDIAMMDVNYSNDSMENKKQINTTLSTFATIVVPNLLRLANPTYLSFPNQLGPDVLPLPSAVPTIASSLSTVHLRAVECTNNFLLSMIDIVEGRWWFTYYKEDAKKMWTNLFELSNKVIGKGVRVGAEEPGQEMRGKILEALVGCLWTVARGLDSEVPLSENQIHVLIDCYKLSVSETIHNKIIGTLGVIAKRQNAIDDNKLIGAFLVKNLQDLLKSEFKSPECIIEILNAMYDVYSDKNFDYDEPVFVKGNYLYILENVANAVYKMTKSIDGSDACDLLIRADEVYENLLAFITYKKEERQDSMVI